MKSKKTKEPNAINSTVVTGWFNRVGLDEDAVREMLGEHTEATLSQIQKLITEIEKLKHTAESETASSSAEEELKMIAADLSERISEKEQEAALLREQAEQYRDENERLMEETRQLREQLLKQNRGLISPQGSATELSAEELDKIPLSEGASKKAARLYEKAKRGNKGAQNNLACAYYEGDGVEKRIDLAIAWWKRAAIGGNSYAQLNLGRKYFLGDGVMIDLEKAAYWWEKAAKQGDGEASHLLSFCYRVGVGVPKDEQKEKKWKNRSVLSMATVVLFNVGWISDFIAFCMVVFWGFFFNWSAFLPSVSGVVFAVSLAVGSISLISAAWTVVFKLAWKNYDAGFFVILVHIIDIVLICVMVCIADPVKKYDYARDGILYEVVNEQTLGVGAVESYVRDAVILAEIDGHGISLSDSKAFRYNDKIRSVTLQDGVTSIGIFAFDQCTSLETVVIPASVNYIGSSAFSGCTNIKKVTIPEKFRTSLKLIFDGKLFGEDGAPLFEVEYV